MKTIIQMTIVIMLVITLIATTSCINNTKNPQEKSASKDEKIAPAKEIPFNDIAVISTGYNNTFAVKTDGTLWAWGSNQFGKLGDGTETDRNTPVQIGKDTDWVTVSAGQNHSTALKTNGTLWTWGKNDYGQLANGSFGGGSKVPILADDGRINWVSLSAGEDYTIGIRTDDRLFAWGRNDYGQLGSGGKTNKFYSEQVGTGWKMVSAGNGFTVAIKTNNALYAWGLNDKGQLGYGNNNERLTIFGDGIDSPDWSMVSVGQNHTVAIKIDGTLWAWGQNSYGQLGDGTNVDRRTPVKIGTDTNWKMVSAGHNHTVALKIDGSLWAWGLNSNGQLGNGTTTSIHTPVEIGKDWKTVSAGNNFTAGIKTDGGLWMWGANSYGQLGNGSNNDCHIPVKIMLNK